MAMLIFSQTLFDLDLNLTIDLDDEVKSINGNEDLVLGL